MYEIKQPKKTSQRNLQWRRGGAGFHFNTHDCRFEFVGLLKEAKNEKDCYVRSDQQIIMNYFNSNIGSTGDIEIWSIGNGILFARTLSKTEIPSFDPINRATPAKDPSAAVWWIFHSWIISPQILDPAANCWLLIPLTHHLFHAFAPWSLACQSIIIVLFHRPWTHLSDSFELRESSLGFWMLGLQSVFLPAARRSGANSPTKTLMPFRRHWHVSNWSR